MYSGDGLHLLPIKIADLNRHRFRRVLPSTMELGIRGDTWRALTLQLRACRNPEHRYVSYMHNILQCIRDGCRHVVSLLL